jgi:hypothetical protein
MTRIERYLTLIIKSEMRAICYLRHLQNRIPAADGGSRLPPLSLVSRLRLSLSWVERENVCQSTAVKRSTNDIISDFFEINQKFDNLKVFMKFKIINNIKSFYV